MSRNIVNLEVHVSDSCNLACESCSHYSNHNHRGNLTLDTLKTWSEPWNKRIRPKIISLLGGEPCVNKNLPEIVIATRELWPDSSVRVVTNGLLLHRHPNLPLVLKQAGNSVLHVSIHHHSLEYLTELSENMMMIKGWVQEHEIDVMFENCVSGWSRRYTGFGDTMRPYNNGNKRASWVACKGKFCRQLHDGKIWKCAPVAYLNQQNEKYNLIHEWKPYLDYSPLEPSCSDEELEAFFSRQEEDCCNMCPSNSEIIEKKNPVRKMKSTGSTMKNIDPFLGFAAFSPQAQDPAAVLRAAGSSVEATHFQRINGKIVK